MYKKIAILAIFVCALLGARNSYASGNYYPCKKQGLTGLTYFSAIMYYDLLKGLPKYSESWREFSEADLIQLERRVFFLRARLFRVYTVHWAVMQRAVSALVSIEEDQQEVIPIDYCEAQILYLAFNAATKLRPELFSERNDENSGAILLGLAEAHLSLVAFLSQGEKEPTVSPVYAEMIENLSYHSLNGTFPPKLNARAKNFLEHVPYQTRLP